MGSTQSRSSPHLLKDDRSGFETQYAPDQPFRTIITLSKRYFIIRHTHFKWRTEGCPARVQKLGRIHCMFNVTFTNEVRLLPNFVDMLQKTKGTIAADLIMMVMMVLCQKAGCLAFTPPGDEMSEVVSRCLTHRQLWVSNLSKVATQWREVDSNPWSSVCKAQNIPQHHRVPT